MEDTKGKLRSLCMENAQQLFNELSPDINERLEFELRQIQGLEMENTFLVCYHLAQLIKKEKGLIGPSPASSSGSLVLYILGVSMLNPLQHGLLFEHFFPIDRIGTIAVGIEVDVDSLNSIRYLLSNGDFLYDNMQIQDSPLCNILELIIDENIIQLRGSEIFTELLKMRKDSSEMPTEFESLTLNNKNVFQKLISNNEIVKMRKIDVSFLVGFTTEQEAFLSQFAPKSIEELAQVLVYLKPWCQYDFKSILKRRNGEKDLTQFQKKYFGETNGIYTFPEQVSSMLMDYLGFSSQQIYSYYNGVQNKVSRLQISSEKLFYNFGSKYDYDTINLEQTWSNMIKYNRHMTNKTTVVAEALLVYWWVWVCSINNPKQAVDV